MDKRIYPVLLLMLIVASYFHIQVVVLALSGMIIALPMKDRFAALKMGRLFYVLLLPIFFGLIAGFSNSNYLILKDAYYFSIPVFLILAGIVLAYRMDIGAFLKTLVIAGAVTSVIVTCISVAYNGLGALADPYSAHYAIGIVGTPAPPVALGCLLLTKKFNIRLFIGSWYRVLVGLNALGIYMFASRSYFIVVACFLFLLVADRIKRVWIMPIVLVIAIFFTFLPTGLFKETSSATLTGKIMGSFGEITIGDYNSEQDINLRYRGYESFMALNSYMEGSPGQLLFGGLGKLIDLKTFVRLGEDVDFRYIPVLHNGWLYLLVKTGIFGVLTYLTVFIGLVVMYWRKYADKQAKPAIRVFAAMSIGCILSLLLTNYIVTSFFNVEMSVLTITLGYSFFNFNYLVERMKQRERINTSEEIMVNELTYSI
jgi:hypothetical protein